jgi:hypothetical protein
MKPDEQRMAIAKACGWIPRYDDAKANLRHWLRPNKSDSNTYFLPNYLNDLNAMHEAEKSLPSEHARNSYLNILHEITSESEMSDVDIDFAWCIATAAQRARAFLETLNLWKD